MDVGTKMWKGRITIKIGTKQTKIGDGQGQGRAFFPTNLSPDWKKVMGMSVGSWGQGEGSRPSLSGTVYRTAGERGMTTLVFLDWRYD